MPGWRWTNLVLDEGICPLFKTQLRKATPKPYTRTVRETHFSLEFNISSTTDSWFDFKPCTHTKSWPLHRPRYCPVTTVPMEQEQGLSHGRARQERAVLLRG